jgi:hypothetical protein
MTLEFIDTIPTDVLEEMLEDISLGYPSREDFYESLNEFLSYQILTESAASVSAERQRRLQAAANKNATAEKRRRDKFQRKQTTQKITQGVKGKYDRRPWYKKAFNKLGKWVNKGIESLKNKKNKEDDTTTEVVYTTAPSTRSTSNRAVTTSNRTGATTSTNAQQQTPEQPKPKTETQIRAGKLRAERKATENKKKITYNKFKEKTKAAKFKRMPKPDPAQILNRKSTSQSTPTPSTEPRHPDATGNAAPPAAVRRGNPASPEATRERNRRRPTAPNPPAATSMRP